MAKRKNFGPIVAIAAITPDKKLVVEKIFRVPQKELWYYIYELPAGLMDIAGENPKETARRELMEETGFTSDPLKVLLPGPFNPGLLEDNIYFFVGTNAHKVSEPQLEGTEDITVMLMSPEEILGHIDAYAQAIEAHLDGHTATVEYNGPIFDQKVAGVIQMLRRRGLV